LLVNLIQFFGDVFFIVKGFYGFLVIEGLTLCAFRMRV